MDLSIPSLICLCVMTYSIIKSFRDVMAESDLGEALVPIISGCSTIISFFIVLVYYEKFSQLATEILSKFLDTSLANNGILNICLILAMFELIRFLILLFLKFLNSFSLNHAINRLNRNKLFLATFSLMFGAIRGFIIILLICIPLVVYNSLANTNLRLTFLDGFAAYDKMEELVDKQRVESISSGVMENISNSRLIYYNGVTIEDGVKSNSEIDSKALEITKRATSDREKAHELYKWVGSSIKYDDVKASKVMNEEVSYESGAIPTFRDKSGICFDYACLYTAMLKANDIKVRIIVGDAYNGKEFISHAWNEVYLSDEDKWVKVDPTFYIAGNYFDSEGFDKEHKAKNVAGEF